MDENFQLWKHQPSYPRQKKKEKYKQYFNFILQLIKIHVEGKSYDNNDGWYKSEEGRSILKILQHQSNLQVICIIIIRTYNN